MVGSAAGVAIALVTLAALLKPYGPKPSPQDFSTVDPVSGSPALWMAAVCSPQFGARATGFHLPNATYSTVCQARIHPDGGGAIEPILIARFPSEEPLQLDLDNNGVEWYAFAVDQGGLVAFATCSPLVASDPHTNLGESPLLVPLKQFGFTIYSDPGLSDNMRGN